MKRIITVAVGLSIIGALGFYLAHSKSPPVPSSDSALQSEAVTLSAPPTDMVQKQPTRQHLENTEPSAVHPSPASVPIPNAATKTSLTFRQAIDSLVSPQTTFQQKQATWKQLREAGQLDQTIAELEQRAAANPSAPEFPAALGQACLQKASTIQDIREQGILGMKADQSFEAALNLDGSNWEARYWKACAMSYWPPQLNKGQEVLEQFVQLVDQQEAQPPQPHFAQTYALLGDQYQKQGYTNYAKEIYHRGLGLFPNEPTLKEKLASVP